MAKISIGWLYPKQMSTYGDRGNILCLYKRLKWRGIEAKVEEIDIGDKIDPTLFDIFFFGGGQDQAQKIISQDLLNKKESLRKAVRLGSVFLGICGGYQLFGHYYRPKEGGEILGLGILDVFTIAGDKRMIGNIVLQNEELPLKNKILVGFENHSGKTYLGKQAHPLGKVVVGFGNNGEDRNEGAYQENVFGCYLHGPFLPKNPSFADYLITKALERTGQGEPLKPLNDTLEEETQLAVIARAKENNRLH